MKMKSAVAAAAVLTLYASGAIAGKAHETHGKTAAAEEHKQADEDIELVSARGEIIDIACHVRHDSKGKEHAKCVVFCADLGMPLGFLEDGTNRVYLIIPSGHGDPKEAVLDHMGKRVKLKGISYPAGELHTLEVTEISDIE